MKYFNTYMWLIGAMDVCTGLLLLFLPVPTLRLMGLTDIPLQPIFISWIGVFVFSIGCAYWLPFLERRSDVRRIQQIMSLKLTSLARFCVGVFVICAICMASLTPAWLLVGLVDLCCATFQLFLLQREVLST